MRDLVALACLLQAIEDLPLARTLEANRPWAISREEIPRGLRWLFGPRAVKFTLALRIAAALTLWFTPRAVDVAALVFGTWVWGVRWRGTINGGSDQMTIVVLVGSFLTLIGHEFAGLAFVAVNVALAYAIAGVAKVRTPEWRRGEALVEILRGAGWSAPPAPRVFAWAVMAFELSFPLALLVPTCAPVYVGLALIFHLGNAYVFGLNRFLFAWGAAYPAVLFWRLAL